MSPAVVPAAALGALAAAAAAALLVRPRPRWPRRAAAPSPGRDSGLLRRHRVLVSVLAGLGGATVVGGAAGPVVGLGAAAGAWVVVTRSEPPGVRRRAEQVRRDLPALVTLLAAALRSGAPPTDALAAVCGALPGPAADRLATVLARLDLGDDPVSAWGELARDPDLGSLGRALGRAHVSGAPVVGAVERLAADLAGAARASVEDRARAVGVKAAVPLGLCLLPSFVLIGIVPLVAGLAGSLGW